MGKQQQRQVSYFDLGRKVGRRVGNSWLWTSVDQKTHLKNVPKQFKHFWRAGFMDGQVGGKSNQEIKRQEKRKVLNA
ncbi:MAG: hypothetical protein PF440_11930 [Thiomicrorhabdus sp.]|jgi:hypothetical protein|nr:hypothetical protein [Thiomicrorhabdus sp.]